MAKKKKVRDMSLDELKKEKLEKEVNFERSMRAVIPVLCLLFILSFGAVIYFSY